MKKVVFSALMVLVLGTSLVLSACSSPAPTAAPDSTDATDETEETVSAPAAEVIRWRMQTYAATGDSMYENAVQVAERINEATGGRLVVDIYSGGAIVPERQEIPAVGNGEIEACTEDIGEVKNLFPSSIVIAEGSLSMTAVQALLWHQGEGLEFSRKVLEPLNVHVVAPNAILGPEIWAHSTKPLNSLDDLQGLRMRVRGVPGIGLAKLGVTVSEIAGGELYESAMRGVIDAFEYATPESNWAMAFQEVADYVYLSPYRCSYAMHHVVVNSDKWAELPDDLKAVVTQVTSSQVVANFAKSIDTDAEALQMFKDYGCTVEPLPKDIEQALIDEMKIYYDEQSAGDEFYASVVAAQRAWAEKCNLQNIR